MELLDARAGRFVAIVLGADMVAHLYWLTGATWPFADTRALSMAVIGWPVPFTPPVLIPLAIVLGVAATALWRGSRRVAVLVALAAAVQVPIRVAWAVGLGDREALFRWLNVGVYLPACVLLALAAYRVARTKVRSFAL